MSNENIKNDKKLIKIIKVCLADDIINIKYWQDADKDKQMFFKSGSGWCSVPYVHCFYIVNEWEMDYNLSISIFAKFLHKKSFLWPLRGKTLFIDPYG